MFSCDVLRGNRCFTEHVCFRVLCLGAYGHVSGTDATRVFIPRLIIRFSLIILCELTNCSSANYSIFLNNSV